MIGADVLILLDRNALFQFFEPIHNYVHLGRKLLRIQESGSGINEPFTVRRHVVAAEVPRRVHRYFEQKPRQTDFYLRRIFDVDNPQRDTAGHLTMIVEQFSAVFGPCWAEPSVSGYTESLAWARIGLDIHFVAWSSVEYWRSRCFG